MSLNVPIQFQMAPYGEKFTPRFVANIPDVLEHTVGQTISKGGFAPHDQSAVKANLTGNSIDSPSRSV